jgi:hypothetical protein
MLIDNGEENDHKQNASDDPPWRDGFCMCWRADRGIRHMI